MTDLMSGCTCRAWTWCGRGWGGSPIRFVQAAMTSSAHPCGALRQNPEPPYLRLVE